MTAPTNTVASTLIVPVLGLAVHTEPGAGSPASVETHRHSPDEMAGVVSLTLAVVVNAGEALDHCRRRVQQDTQGDGRAIQGSAPAGCCTPAST